MKDIVKLTSAQMTWLRSHAPAEFHHFPLPSFELILDDSTPSERDMTAVSITYDYDLAEQVLNIATKAIFKSNSRKFTIKVKQGVTETGREYWECLQWAGPDLGHENMSQREMLEYIVASYSCIQGFMLKDRSDLFDVVNKTVKYHSKAKRRKTIQSRKVRFFKQYTCKREYQEIDIPLKSKKHEIACPCWSVRGHYRHYKSGKVVFIESYEKGKSRGELSKKEYQLVPDTIAVTTHPLVVFASDD